MPYQLLKRALLYLRSPEREGFTEILCAADPYRADFFAKKFFLHDIFAKNRLIV
jgi:hypothetical protein